MRLIEESVERIDQQGVWWRDSQGRQWIGNEPTLMPTRAIIKNGEKAEIANVVIEATGDLFPLVPGKTVAYRYTSQGGFYAAQTHEQSCTVAGYEPAQTAAGTFDTYRLECIYNGLRRNNFYAPALGRVVLQTADTIVDSVKRELVGFDRGPSEPARVAQKPPMQHGAGKSMANSMPTSTIAQPAVKDLASSSQPIGRKTVPGKPGPVFAMSAALYLTGSSRFLKNTM